MRSTHLQGRVLDLRGEVCSSDGADGSCAGSLQCAQKDNNNYVCCDKDKVIQNATFYDWCSGLENGEGCSYDAQCKSGECGVTGWDPNGRRLHKCTDETAYCWWGGHKNEAGQNCSVGRWHDVASFPTMKDQSWFFGA